MKWVVATLLALWWLRLAPARADVRSDDEHQPAVVLAFDLPLTALTLGIWGFTDLFENRIGPTRCRWCDTTSSLNAFDRLGREAFAGANRTFASNTSDILAYGFIPAIAFGLDYAAVFQKGGIHRGRKFLIDAIIIAESLSTAMTFTQIVKFSVARRRPDKLDLPPSTTIPTVDENLSFFSGHTTLAFSMATSAGMLCTMRHEHLAPRLDVGARDRNHCRDAARRR